MSDFNVGVYPVHPVISTIDPLYSALGWSRTLGTASSVNTAQTQRVTYMPIVIPAPFVLRSFWWCTGSTGTNIDMGIYTQDGTKITSMGSTAMVSSNVIESYSIPTPVTLYPGNYYIAAAVNSNAGSLYGVLFSGTPGLLAVRRSGMREQATTFPCPATATFGTAGSFVPVCGIASRTVI